MQQQAAGGSTLCAPLTAATETAPRHTQNWSDASDQSGQTAFWKVQFRLLPQHRETPRPLTALDTNPTSLFSSAEEFQGGAGQVGVSLPLWRLTFQVNDLEVTPGQQRGPGQPAQCPREGRECKHKHVHGKRNKDEHLLWHITP